MKQEKRNLTPADKIRGIVLDEMSIQVCFKINWNTCTTQIIMDFLVLLLNIHICVYLNTLIGECERNMNRQPALTHLTLHLNVETNKLLEWNVIQELIFK